MKELKWSGGEWIRDGISTMRLTPNRTNESFKVFVFVSTETKQSIFASISVFVVFHSKSDFLKRFLVLSTLKRPKTLIEATEYDACLVSVFKSLRFCLSTLETERFQNAPLAFTVAFTKASAFISVFCRFWCGRYAKYAYSNENALAVFIVYSPLQFLISQ